MPVRSLNSSVLTWPDRQDVERALEQWLETHVSHRSYIMSVGYFGSYAHQ